MKKENWFELLLEYAECAAGVPFEWGSHDCCTFAAGAIEAMTGVDPMPEFRGHYNDKEGADEALKTIGKGSLYSTLRGKFGNAIKPAMAQRGDLMMADADGAPALLICMGERSMGPGADGLVYWPTLQCLRGWRI